MSATLVKELEAYLSLVAKSPQMMMVKTTYLVETSDEKWAQNDKTTRDILRYIHTHRKVDGKEWCCGEFGSRWADTAINGKQCRMCFYSKKSNPMAFENITQSYKFVIEVIEDETSKRDAKRKQNSEEYAEARTKAIKYTDGAVITSNADMRDLLRITVRDRRKSEGETVFFWHRKQKNTAWLDNQGMREQAKIWKKEIKGGERLQLLEHNCQTKLINGEEWHILVLGHQDDDWGIDPTGMGIDDGCFVVTGLIYWFKHRESRDTIFKYLTE
jgi:hypothetical protein